MHARLSMASTRGTMFMWVGRLVLLWLLTHESRITAEGHDVILVKGKEREREREAFVFSVQYLPELFFGILVQTLGFIFFTSDASINSNSAWLTCNFGGKVKYLGPLFLGKYSQIKSWEVDLKSIGIKFYGLLKYYWLRFSPCHNPMTCFIII